MTGELLAIDPQALAVLQEIAADPASTLLRIAPSKTLASFREGALGAGRFTAGLTVAERELLQVHRAEVAWLLRQACVVMLVEGDAGRRFVNTIGTSGEPLELMTPSEIAVRAERERSSADLYTRSALDSLVGFAAWPTTEAPGIRELAALAHGLEPTNQTRLIVALDMAMKSELRTALHLLSEVEMLGPSDHERLRAQEYTALVLARLGKHAEACQRLRRSNEIDPRETTAAMSRLLCGLTAGLRHHVVEAAHVLEGTITADNEIVRTFIAGLIRQRKRGEWTFTSEARRLAGSLADDLGTVSGRILDGLA